MLLGGLKPIIRVLLRRDKMKFHRIAFLRFWMIFSLYHPCISVFADGDFPGGGAFYFGTVPTSLGNYIGAGNPPPLDLSPNKRRLIIGKCIVYVDAEDTIGYPCPRLTIEVYLENYSDESQIVTSVQTEANGDFIAGVDPEKSYVLRVKSSKYEMRKAFTSPVRAGEVIVPLQPKFL